MAINLKLGDRLAIIKDGVKKGQTPQQAIQQYKINKDGGYNNWKNQFKQTTGINPDQDDTYNYEQFFKENPEAAKQLIQGKVSPDILQMYKTPQAIQRERQIQQQKRNNINSLMDYSQYEKLINDYMNKSVNIQSCGGLINIYAEGTQDLNTNTTTEVGLTPSQWRTTKSPDTIQVTPEELKSFKRVLMNIPENIQDVPEDYRNLPQNTRFIQVPWEFIESISPDSKRPASDSEFTTYYIQEDIDDQNPQNYYTIHRLREHSSQGRAYDYWKKEQAWEDRQSKQWLYNYGDGEKVNIGTSELLPEVVVDYDYITDTYNVDPQEQLNELPTNGSKPINYEEESSLIDGQGSSNEEYYNPYNMPNGSLNVPNNNPYSVEGVSGGSSFGNGTQGIKMPDIFNMNIQDIPYQDLQFEPYQWQQEELEYLNPPGYVPIPNWDVQQIADTGEEGMDFADFMKSLAGYKDNSLRDELMLQLFKPKDYFADPYAGSHYTDTQSFYDAYNNNPYNKIQRESNGIPLYANGGKINIFGPGGFIYIPDNQQNMVARQDETYRPVRQLNEAINRSYERIKAKTTTPRQKVIISQKQENYNVAQRRQRQVTTQGYEHTKRQKQQYKKEDIQRAKRHRAERALSSDKPVITQRPQAQLWDKDKVDLAKTQQAFYRDAAANIGVNWGNNLDPYNQSDLINNAAQSFGMSNLAPYTLPAFGSFTSGMAARTFMGSSIGGELGGLIGSQIGSTISDSRYAPLIGGAIGGSLGGGLGSYIPNRNYIRLANALNNNIRNAKVNLSYIRPDFNRFRLGDVEINNPSLYYRQGSIGMGDDFLNTGVVREGGGYANPMFARGKLWYGIPTKEMLTQGRQLKVGRFNLTTKANVAAPKTDLLISTGEMVPSNAKAMLKSSIHTKKRLHPYSEVDIKNAKTNSMRDFMLEFNDKYYNGELDDLANITHVDTEYVRRIPATKNSANSKNTTLYRYDPQYGYRKVKPTPDFVEDLFATKLVDSKGKLTQSIDDIFEKLKKRLPYSKSPEELLNKGFKGKTNLKEHIRDVVKSAQKYPLPKGVTRQDFVTAALYHDLGKVINSSRSHGNTSNYIIDLMNWYNNKNIARSITEHMNDQEFFTTASPLTKALHIADVGRGMPFKTLIKKYPYLRHNKNNKTK